MDDTSTRSDPASAQEVGIETCPGRLGTPLKRPRPRGDPASAQEVGIETRTVIITGEVIIKPVILPPLRRWELRLCY